jgi:hypothetical protein
VGEGEDRATEEPILLASRTPGDPGTPVGSDAVGKAVRDLTALGGVLTTSLAAPPADTE